MKPTKLKMKKVAMILLTCNQKKMVEECIDSIFKKTDYKNYKIFLVDNGSEDRHDLMVKKKFPLVHVLRNEKNLGYGKGNNQGIDLAYDLYNPDYFVLLNDDMEVINKDWLKDLINIAESDKDIGIVGSQSIYPNGDYQISGGHMKGYVIDLDAKYEKEEVLDVDHLDIVCALVKREVMDALVGFDEDFTPFLLEDTDYCLRAKEGGWSIKLDTGNKVIHKKSQTIHAMDNKYNMLIRFKNDLIFSRRHLKGKDKLFRMFVFLPMVAILKKKRDEDELKLKNFKIRPDFLRNLYYYIIAFNRKIYKGVLRRGGIEV